MEAVPRRLALSTVRPFLLPKNPLLLADFETQRQKNFSLGRHSTGFAPLDPIERQRRNAGQPGELGLAQHHRFPHLPDIVGLIHLRSSSGQGKVPLSILRAFPKSIKLTLIMRN